MPRKYQYLPQVRDSDGQLRNELEAIRAHMSPDTTISDVIRLAIREFIAKKRE
jgi:hypothetical protein